ncbi:dienelactone hydrolase family protein [Lysobacter sp. TY2-98]|uniref:dienelactone hydrolase family protein n=1 Tax=Lysobacter sp. TY2-98 TaxID=2290922 RepID=UPI000E209E8F|nr:dienelactone hydrolase family protein [Lysobacter sp. TY2-98]AXK71443.1 dienelactone hydrolase family protein [Lysobacter sp. TY2-98]
MSIARRYRIASTALLLLAAAHAQAAVRTRNVDWTLDGEKFQGVLVYDDAGPKSKPGLVMVPNWMGVNPSAVEKAKKVAGRDYVVLVADVYGANVRPKDAKEAGAAAGALKGDRGKLRARTQKAVDALRAQARSAPLDARHIGAFGFCFGGTSVLELVRSGAALDGAVTLHGGLDATTSRAAPGTVKTPLLVLNGAADKNVPRDDVAKLQAEMTAGGGDWQFVDFGGAVHCFAEADAGNDPNSNCRYDAKQAPRAYRMLADFFAERFASARAGVRK